jgi:malate dehydrogenase (oxaloacetate-decarboxylating)
LIGKLTEGMKGLQPFQAIFAQKRERVAGWKLSSDGQIGLLEVVANARPTVLIGTSGQAHAFSEAVVRGIAQHVQRPIIFPLSNPTERSEATPQDLLAWTKDRAVVGTGSPFPTIIQGGQAFRIDQVNNAYVFPGVGLGAIAVKARLFLKECFSRQHGQLPTCLLRSVIRTPIYYHRLSNR